MDLSIKKIFIFGSTGMAGHVITQYLESLNRYIIFNASLDRLNDKTIIINVEDKELVEEILTQKKPDIVINCIGLLIKDSAKYPDKAIYLNSFFPHYLVQLGKHLKYKLIHLSTDCVFSGKRGNYSEEDIKDGVGYYACSKALGEIINDKDLTFRTSIIGPELKPDGSGLFHWFMNQKGTVNGYSNVYWTGITTLELAKGIHKAIEQNIKGLYHLVSEKISKYELLNLIKEIWDIDIRILEDFDHKNDKSLLNNRDDFNYKIPSYYQMLMELHEWMKNWNDYNYNY